MRTFLTAVVVVLAATVTSASAATGSQALTDFYNKVDTLSTDFQQVQRDDSGNIVQQASGTFLLSRPDRFRWEYTQPFEQIIVSDGQTFKFYDVDLSQVTIRDVSATLNATPALLLTGGEALSEAFKITDGGQHDGLDWVHLTPNADDTDFKAVDLGLKNNVPHLMKLHDNLGQTTSISFGNIKVNPKIDAKRFKLDIPDDVEVVDGRETSTSMR
ncbi:outer membrane lipoprotein chaperone LolA [uncultured Salinisphaera sp.]|uniref:outer membrane lipoprotein chaperone LolA n=1 Tax=uncultured Salinisphaera sp. TaxID=359372 RepID=UPI0032B20521|tara:strand:+ start:6102 stop:6746 length:645 start_codon:yes stop_codon:yes gene_type:complete